MAERARLECANDSRISILTTSAEKTGLTTGTVDAVLIASAYHWMNRPAVNDELLRILKPGGAALIFEYRFPIVAARPKLNEWIRRQFNTLWKLPEQTPRGKLKELLQALLVRPEVKQWRPLGDLPGTPPFFEQQLTVEALAGLIFSQARFESYSRSLLGNEARAHHRTDIGARLHEFFDGAEALAFEFPLRGFLIEKRGHY